MSFCSLPVVSDLISFKRTMKSQNFNAALDIKEVQLTNVGVWALELLSFEVSYCRKTIVPNTPAVFTYIPLKMRLNTGH